jgi:hypothetical protein
METTLDNRSRACRWPIGADVSRLGFKATQHSQRCRDTGMCHSRLPRRRPEGRGTQCRVIHRTSDGFGGSASEFTSGSRPLNTSRACPELDSAMDLFSVALRRDDTAIAGGRLARRSVGVGDGHGHSHRIAICALPVESAESRGGVAGAISPGPLHRHRGR